jgi:hypothetical protein
MSGSFGRTYFTKARRTSTIPAGMDKDGLPSKPLRGLRRVTTIVAALLAVGLVSVSVSTAASTPSIEGIWSFSGGQIAVQPEGNGKFEGVVVQPTLFASCTHPTGQKIWKEMTSQSDGSYWGFHQWYKTESCVENPVLGPSAWRVVTQTGGSRYLRVCLSSPGTEQPTIAPDSSGTRATYGCESSSLTAPLAGSGVGSFRKVVSLPGTRKCLSLRKFQIHIRNAQFDPFKTVSVTLRGRAVPVVLHGQVYVATINLRGLPRGAFTIKIKATTVRGDHVNGSRSYHTCAKKTRKKSKPRHTAARGK